MPRPIRLAPLAVALLTVAACSRNRSAPTPAPEAPAATSPASDDDAARRAAERDRAEREARERAERERLARLEGLRATMVQTIWFDFDRSDLTADARARLDAKLPLLNANADVRIRIAGHTDERGSDEYNLALGQRRAAAAKRYLTQRGIAGDRIEIVSRGEEQGVCASSDESCWSRNRRDEFEILVGALAER